LGANFLTAEEEISKKVNKIRELKEQIESLEKEVHVKTRKLQSTRTGTYLLALPKDWCNKHGLKKGSLVTICEQESSLIIIP
jgi:hypothetical protein